MQSLVKIENSSISIFLSGEMKFNDRTQFWNFLKQCEAPEIKTIIIDCARLEFIDSAGLALILNAHDQFLGKGKSIVLKNPKGQVEKMFVLSGFGSLFTIAS